MKAHVVALSLVCGIAVGCVSGKKFDVAAVHCTRVGMTTNEVRALVGDPYRITDHKEKKQSWLWRYNNGLTATRAIIVFETGLATDVPAINPRSDPSELTAEKQAVLDQAIRNIAARRDEAEQRQLAEQNARHLAAVEQYASQKPSVAKDLLDAMRDQKIKFGMTREQVVLTWGPPHRASKTVTAYGSSETLSYPITTVFLENGRVSGWHSSE